MLLSRIDIGDDAVNSAEVIGQQFYPIAGQRLEVTQSMRQARNKLQSGRQVWLRGNPRTDLRLRLANKPGSTVLHLNAARR